MGTQTPESVKFNANLQPQATKSYQNTSFPYSVNSHATFIFPEDSLINSTSSRDPTLEQAQAIETLRYYHSSDVIAWHTLSQSTEPDLSHRDAPGGLSIQAIRAISVLSSCSRENLLQWFESGTLLHRKLLSNLQTADTIDSKPEGSTKFQSFHIQVCNCSLFTSNPTTVASICPYLCPSIGAKIRQIDFSTSKQKPVQCLKCFS